MNVQENRPIDTGDLVSVKDIADRSGLDPYTVRRYIYMARNGLTPEFPFPVYRRGQWALYDWNDWVEWRKISQKKLGKPYGKSSWPRRSAEAATDGS